MSKRILLVEDESDLRLMLRDLLTMEGYEVEEAADGSVALGKVSGDRPVDLVILDLMMPAYDGRYFLEHLADRTPLRVPPILIATAAPQRAPPGYRLLPKPTSVDQLLTTVSEMVA